MPKEVKETPLMKQYNRIKAKYPDALLLFRVGDFYETFGVDAVKASGILGIILTKRGAGSLSETELAGFPHHSINTYLPKLVKAGCRVAICDQLEDPKMTKTIVKRGVTELITPGVSLHDDVLDQKKNNYLAAIFYNKCWGVSFLDISTGDFLVAEGDPEEIEQLLQTYSPSEVLVPKPKKQVFKNQFGSHYPYFFVEDWAFEISTAKQKLISHFQTNSLEGFGIQNHTAGISAAGAVMHYLSETQHDKLQHITRINPISQGSYVWLDHFDMSSATGYMGAKYVQEYGRIFLACHVPNDACHGVSISIVSISSVSCRVRIPRVSMSMPCRGHPGVCCSCFVGGNVSH